MQNHFFGHFWLLVDVAAESVRLPCTLHLHASMHNVRSTKPILSNEEETTKICCRSNLAKYWAKGKLIAEDGARKFCPALDTSGVAKNLPNLSYFCVIR